MNNFYRCGQTLGINDDFIYLIENIWRDMVFALDLGKYCRMDECKIRRCVQLSCSRAKNRDDSSWCSVDAAVLHCGIRDGTNALVPK